MMKKTMMNKDVPQKMLKSDSGARAKPSIPAMPHPDPTGFKAGKMNQNPAMGGAGKIGKGFDNHEKCC